MQATPDSAQENPRAVELTAYQICEWEVPIVPASYRRDWMIPHAYHCLPMTLANQSGWFLLLPHEITAVWDGSDSEKGLTISFPDGKTPDFVMAKSHFGQGIVSFGVPFLFRTSPGYDLVIKGPSNYILPNAQALEGLIEADWSPMSFTMNWKLHSPGIPVTFRAGEPYCMIHPQRRGDIESTRPEIRRLEEDPALKEEFLAFLQKRNFNRAHNKFRQIEREKKAQTRLQAYDRDYFLGRKVTDPKPIEGHRLRLNLKPFRDLRTPSEKR